MYLKVFSQQAGGCQDETKEDGSGFERTGFVFGVVLCSDEEGVVCSIFESKASSF